MNLKLKVKNGTIKLLMFIILLLKKKNQKILINTINIYLIYFMKKINNVILLYSYIFKN